MYKHCENKLDGLQLVVYSFEQDRDHSLKQNEIPMKRIHHTFFKEKSNKVRKVIRKLNQGLKNIKD